MGFWRGLMISLSGRLVRRGRRAGIWNHRCTPMDTDRTGASAPERLARGRLLRYAPRTAVPDSDHRCPSVHRWFHVLALPPAALSPRPGVPERLDAGPWQDAAHVARGCRHAPEGGRVSRPAGRTFAAGHGPFTPSVKHNSAVGWFPGPAGDVGPLHGRRA